uniref:Uncharacterized protein n=1 Tax=Arthrobotrys musiformis TaxID=47236 RepID=A0A482EAM3_9PEZI|nr:hypothetical protein [Arthrobotrys musiformis]
MWYPSQFYAYRNSICFNRKIPNLTKWTIICTLFNSHIWNKCTNPFLISRKVTTRNYVTTNGFLTKLEKNVLIKYNTLPNNSLIKQPNSLVANRIIMSHTEVIKTIYGLDYIKDIKHYFHKPGKLNVPGIYLCKGKY